MPIPFYVNNDLIDLVLECLPDDYLTSFYERLIIWRPNNVVLMQRACEHFIKEGNRAAARGISMTALQCHPACLSLWKIHMAQVQREGSYSEVKKLYRRALQHISLTLSLWKDVIPNNAQLHIFSIILNHNSVAFVSSKFFGMTILCCSPKWWNLSHFSCWSSRWFVEIRSQLNK